MNKIIVGIAEVFVARKIEPDNYITNFYHILMGFDEDSRGKLLLLIKVVNILSLLRYAKTIDKLELVKRDNLLKKMHNAPINVLRGGITGLRSLCLLSFYSLEENWQMIGFEGKPQS
jgi:hypothetical protein